ncbi:unnamed protein product [Penicillium salamii]|nr:unnamed protein product [Penicillium salamii]CAG8287749.1 unnamed protein product [Penicillium salamii]
MRDSLTKEAKEIYRSMKNATSTKIKELKAKTEATLQYTKAKLKKDTFKGAHDKFFSTINTLKINKQLDPSLLDIDKQAYALEKIVHRLNKHRQVAELIQISIQNLSEKNNIVQRVTLVNALIKLNRVRKVSTERFNPKRQTEYAISSNIVSLPKELPSTKTESSLSPKPQDYPISLTNRHYLFYTFELQYQSYFASSRKAREHFEKHLRKYKPTKPITYPDKYCQLILSRHKALKRYTKDIHHIRYFTKAQRIQTGF